MDPLPTLAAALGQSPGAQPTPAAATTDGLFEHEVGRALERADAEAHFGERSSEARAADVRARRDDRHRGFESGSSGVRERSEEGASPEPREVSVSPSAPARASDPLPGPPAEGGEEFHGTPAEAGAAPTPAATQDGPPLSTAPRLALPAIATVPAPVQAQAVAAGPATPSSATTAPRIEAVTATFLHAARGGPGSPGSPGVGAAGPAADAALVDRAAEVLRQIRLAISPSARRVVVDLNPDELGRLTIKMAMQDGRVSALVRAESAQTLELLERHLPELRAVLAERGVEAGDIELELAFGGESRGQDRRASGAAAGPPGLHSNELSTEEPVQANSATTRTPLDGSVDTYA